MAVVAMLAYKACWLISVLPSVLAVTFDAPVTRGDQNVSTDPAWPFGKGNKVDTGLKKLFKSYPYGRKGNHQVDRVVMENADNSFIGYRAVLSNDGDSCYTTKIKVGGQDIQFVPDTGSFSIVVFSDKCKRCGNKHMLYHADASNSHSETTLQALQTYGSGSTTSTAAYESFTVGPKSVSGQFFWEVVRADMPIIEANNFQGIFGLGAPESEARMAQMEVNDMKEYIERLRKHGENIGEGDSTLKHLRSIFEFTKIQTEWLKGVQMTSFSFCLRPARGAPGVLVYNDNIAYKRPELFSRVKTAGDTYWSVPLSKIQLGGALSPRGKKQVDCWHKSCLGILDTGTSLLAAPPEAITVVRNLVEDWNNQGGDCSDLSKLPDLEFDFGGHQLSLPPQSYVGELNGDLPAWLREALPHVDQFLVRRSRIGTMDNSRPTYCTPLLMSMSQKDDEPPSWIFGLPFFRKYYTSFELSKDSMNTASVAFATSDADCHVGVHSLYRTGANASADRTRSAFRMDANKLRPPRWSRWGRGILADP